MIFVKAQNFRIMMHTNRMSLYEESKYKTKEMMTTNYARGLLNTLDPRKVNKVNKQSLVDLVRYSSIQLPPYIEFKGS